MKQAEWENKIELDLRGVQMLGAVLTEKAKIAAENAERTSKQMSSMNEMPSEFGVRRSSDWIIQEQSALKEWYSEISRLTEELGTPPEAFKRAGKLKVRDFRFRWDQLRDHLILVGYITDDQPEFAATWHRSTPIIELSPSNAVVSALIQVFLSEYERLTGPDPLCVEEKRSEADFLFYLTVWKHCELEKGPGQPTGRRWEDGTDNAASYAMTLGEKAKKSGSPISKDEAIRQALKEFTIIQPEEFCGHHDKEGVIVTASGTEGNRLKGAIKAVRKRLNEFGKKNKLGSVRKLYA